MTGTVALLRANLRRDRVLVPVWVGALVTMVAVSAGAVESLYANTAERVAAAQVINSDPALVALYGPILNESSLGELAMSKMTVTYCLFVMGMAVVIVRRHTRAEEESGRAELLGATLIARSAPLTAALVEGALASAAVGTLAASANIAAGLPAVNSIAFGLSWVGIGLVGTGLAAVACQLTASSRTAGGLAVAAIAVIFAIRAAADVAAPSLGWLSPLGWGTRLDAWGATRWPVLGLYLATTAALVAAAVALRARRDLGSGLLAAGRGRAEGRIGSIPALVWRTNALPLLCWALGAALSGAMFGSVVPHLGGLFNNPSGAAILARMGGSGSVANVMVAALLTIMAALLTGFALQVVSGACAEEAGGRTAVVHAAAGSRARLFLSVTGLVVLGSAALAVSFGVACAIGYGSQVDVGVAGALGDVVPAALAYVPAMWVVAALAVAGLALNPRWVWLGWAVWAACIVLGDIGQQLRFPGWVVGLSPYQHVVKVPVEAVNWGAEGALAGVACGILVLAWLRYRSRELG